MTSDKRVAGIAPLVVEHREIGMTDAAGLDLDLHLLGAKRPDIKSK